MTPTLRSTHRDESFARLYRRVGRSSRVVGIVFIALSVVFLIFSVYYQFIVLQIDSVVAFVAGVILLFRDPRARVQAGVLDAVLVSSGQVVADLAAGTGYAYVPTGKRVEDVVILPTKSLSLDFSTGHSSTPPRGVTPPGRALALLFMHEAGLSIVTTDELETSLPKIVPENLGLADSVEIRMSDDTIALTLHGAAATCGCGGDQTEKSQGTVGCTLASFFAVLYSCATGRPVLLGECVHHASEDAWNIKMKLMKAEGQVSA